VVAREAGIHPGQLYGWRRQLGIRPRIGFAPVRIAPEAAPAKPKPRQEKQSGVVRITKLRGRSALAETDRPCCELNSGAMREALNWRKRAKRKESKSKWNRP
jgi:transposase-like protein